MSQQGSRPLEKIKRPIRTLTRKQILHASNELLELRQTLTRRNGRNVKLFERR